MPAGTSSGVFKSTNGGDIWSPLNSGLTSTTVSTLAIDPGNPSTVYAGTWGGVFKSVVQEIVDFDGDGKTDIAVYRANIGAWYIIPSSTNVPYGQGWGADPTDIPIPGDYDGDRKTDITIYRNGIWAIVPSSGATAYSVGWGVSSDIPVPGDYDGDGKTDIAIYRDGIWAMIPSTGAAAYSVGWGAPGDVPITSNRAPY